MSGPVRTVDVPTPIGRQAAPLTGKIGKAPKLGISGGANGGAQRVPYSRPSDYKSGERRSSSRDGENFNNSRGAGPIRSTNFGPNPMVSDTIGFQSNYWVPVAKMMRSFHRKYQDITQMGHLIITKKDRKPLTIRRGKRNKEDSRRYSMLNITMWNYQQQSCEKMPESPDKVLTPHQVWENWTIEGVVKSEEGTDTPSGNYDEGKEQLLNNIIRGHVLTFNIWGKDVAAGTPLWLILKKTAPRDDGYVIRNIGVDIEDINGIGTKLTNRPFQLFPYASATSPEPHDSVLNYEDEFGFVHRGIALYIGRSEKGSYSNGERALKEIPFSINAIITQPQIFIFVDPDHSYDPNY